jgi:hypothetical protein
VHSHEAVQVTSGGGYRAALAALDRPGIDYSEGLPATNFSQTG